MKKGLSTKKLRILPILIGGLCVLSACNKQELNASNGQSAASKEAEYKQGDLSLWPALKSKVAKTPEIENTIAQYLKTMTLEQKVAQIDPARNSRYNSCRYAQIWFWFLFKWWWFVS